MGEVILYVLAGFAAIAGMIVNDLIRDQAKASTPRLAEWLRRCAVGQLPEGLRERLGEEWAAALDDTAGPIAKLWCAIGFMCSTRAIARVDINHKLTLYLEFQKIIAHFEKARILLLEDKVPGIMNKESSDLAIELFSLLIFRFKSGEMSDEEVAEIVEDFGKMGAAKSEI